MLALGAAIIPVMFSYGGWQTASFVAAEMRDSRRDLARGLLGGVIIVVAIYLLVNIALFAGLGQSAMEATRTPATDLMRAVFGEAGARFIALGITISTLGFLSQGMLTAPRVYHAMAEDKVFFRAVARLDPKSQAPVVAIVLQGAMTVVIALSGTFERILNYVVATDFIFFGLTAGSIFVFRSRASAGPPAGPPAAPGFRLPGHPVTTAIFIVASAAIVANTLVTKPQDSLIGIILLLAGIPVYGIWKSKSRVLG
jgi:APA family basic amino acid/polyamine antiporter